MIHALVILALFAWAAWLMARNQLWHAALVALVGIVKVLP